MSDQPIGDETEVSVSVVQADGTEVTKDDATTVTAHSCGCVSYWHICDSHANGGGPCAAAESYLDPVDFDAVEFLRAIAPEAKPITPEERAASDGIIVQRASHAPSSASVPITEPSECYTHKRMGCPECRPCRAAAPSSSASSARKPISLAEARQVAIDGLERAERMRAEARDEEARREEAVASASSDQTDDVTAENVAQIRRGVVALLEKLGDRTDERADDMRRLLRTFDRLASALSEVQQQAESANAAWAAAKFELDSLRSERAAARVSGSPTAYAVRLEWPGGYEQSEAPTLSEAIEGNGRLHSERAADREDDADSVAREVLCRVFDDGADEGMQEWHAWYKPSEWLWYARGLGAFIYNRLLAKASLTAAEQSAVGELREDMEHPIRDEAGAWVTISMRSANALLSAIATMQAGRAADRQDAERWRAFIGSSRIRFFGTAGPDASGYAHFGGEFWTGVPADRYDEETHATTRANAEWLVKYADTARASAALPETQ